MSREKFDIRQTIYSEMSGKNSKCPAKDGRFAGQNVRRCSNEFRVLCHRSTAGVRVHRQETRSGSLELMNESSVCVSSYSQLFSEI